MEYRVECNSKSSVVEEICGGQFSCNTNPKLLLYQLLCRKMSFDCCCMMMWYTLVFARHVPLLFITEFTNR